MSCVPSDRRIRLLDYLVGWDEAVAEGLEGFDLAAGVHLRRIAGDDLPAGLLDKHIPPPRLAPGCGPCSWYLVTKHPPASRLLRLDACDNCWRPFASLELIDTVAIAADRFRLAIADAGTGLVSIIAASTGQIIGEAAVTSPVALTFSASSTILVASTDPPRLQEYDLSGLKLSSQFPALPKGEVDRLGMGSDCALWLVMRDEDGALSLWRRERATNQFTPSDIASFAEAFPVLPINRTGSRGFCLDRGCWSWQGRATTSDRIGPAPSGIYAEQGQLLTRAIDSGAPRCSWHRLRIDADAPAGTTLEIAFATSEQANPPAQGKNEPSWNAFQAGIPHPADWQSISSPEDDVLIRQPAGRYLFIRIRMTGPGNATPLLRRLHIDLPRATSADLLPVVYREDADASDFTERFVSLFDSVLGTLDEAATRMPALLDARGVPDELLGWVGKVLGVALDGAWPAPQRRDLLAAAPKLFRSRGTKTALSESVRLLAGFEPVIEEPGLARSWGALDGREDVGLRLDRSRLFGPSSARFRVGSSALGRAALHSFGNPDLDPHWSGAFRVRIGLPPVDQAVQQRIANLAEDLVPGHVLIDLRSGRHEGFWLLPGAMIGVDTRLAAPLSPILGSGARLNRTTVLPSRSSRRDGLVLGVSSACGSS